MAVNTNNNGTKSTGTKKFNPTITAMFENDKFGEGALLSANIDAKGFAVVQQQLQIGSKLLIRRSPRLSKSGNTTYFLEILPPLAANTNNTARRASNAADDGI